jgi:hypothetical protein
MKKKTAKNQAGKFTENYSVSLSLGDKRYESEGETLFEALSGIRPIASKGVGSILVTYKGKTSKVPLKLNPISLTRLFVKPIDRELFAKRLMAQI